MAANSKGKIKTGQRLTLRVPIDLNIDERSATLQLTQRILRYEWLIEAVRIEDVLSPAELKIALVALEKWIVDPPELIGMTAAATAKASRKAPDDFLRKLGLMKPHELLVLAHWIDKDRSQKRKA